MILAGFWREQSITIVAPTNTCQKHHGRVMGHTRRLTTTPSWRWVMKSWSCRSSGAFSSRNSMHSKAAFLRSSPSSIVCLKGPRSTTFFRVSSTTVCAISWGRSCGRTSLTKPILLLAVMLSSCTAAFLTRLQSFLLQYKPCWVWYLCFIFLLETGLQFAEVVSVVRV